MAESTAKSNAETTNSSLNETGIMFKCKICGESKPLSDLVVIKNYYPQLSACRACARGKFDHLNPE
jgi:hypothetical protein